MSIFDYDDVPNERRQTVFMYVGIVLVIAGTPLAASWWGPLPALGTFVAGLVLFVFRVEDAVFPAPPEKKSVDRHPHFGPYRTPPEEPRRSDAMATKIVTTNPMRNPDREEARRHADAHGYFWAPCPRCGEYFGGHEWPTADPERRYSIACLRFPGGHGACCPKVSDEEDAKACARSHDRDTIVELLARATGETVQEAERSLFRVMSRLPKVTSTRLHELAVKAGLSASEEQRASFAYGNCVIENPAVTEEMAIAAVLRSRASGQ